MKHTLRALAFAVAVLALAPSLAHAQSSSFPQMLPSNTVMGRLGVSAGPVETIPFLALANNLPLASGKVYIGNAGNFATPQTPSGDWTISNAGLASLATVNANVGAFGSTTQCVTVTNNAKGLTTAVSAATCTPAVGNITGLGTGVGPALAINTGSAGSFYVLGGALGTPSSGVATNLTGLPISTGLTGAGTGILAALGINVGSAGAPVVNGGALGSPSSAGTMPSFTNGGTITGGTYAAITGFGLRDTSAAFDVTLSATSSPVLTAGRSLTFNLHDGTRAFDLAGGVTIAAGGFATSGGNPTTLTTTGTTNVTLPVTGTLATLAGAETLTNKAISGGTHTGITSLGVRDTSAAFDVTLAATSSTALTAGRTFTLDVVNGPRTFKLGSNLTIASDPGAVGGAVRANAAGFFTQAACADLSNAAAGCSAAAGQFPGEPSTGNASAGNAGEYVETVVLVGAAVPLTSGAAKTIATLPLPSGGDWEVDCMVYFAPAASTSVTLIDVSISGSTNVLDTTPGKWYQLPMTAMVPNTTLTAGLPNYRQSVSGATSVFLVAQSTFTVSTMTAYGIIRARRVR
jgi:hypothetical protein